MNKHERDENFSVRTDLAVEMKEMVSEKSEYAEQIPGVYSKDFTIDGIKVNRIEISEIGEKHLNKSKGNYITIFSDGVKTQDTKTQFNTIKVLTSEIQKLLQNYHITAESKALIVGLGNWNVTPDALGPLTVEKVLVTNHLFELEYETVQSGYRPVAAISPGVMGVTGMETSDIVLSIIDQFKPDIVIVIDALASRSIERINETIQITDTGIHPGSGVGNKRKEISNKTLGVPVIAIGVPTVVDAVTIASDTIDYLLKHMGREWKEKDFARNRLLPKQLSIRHERLSEDDLPDRERRTTFLGLVGNLSDEEKRSLLNEVLTPLNKNMMVTPKEIDSLMDDMAHVIASAINAAMHEKIKLDHGESYTR